MLMYQAYNEGIHTIYFMGLNCLFAAFMDRIIFWIPEYLKKLISSRVKFHLFINLTSASIAHKEFHPSVKTLYASF